MSPKTPEEKVRAYVKRELRGTLKFGETVRTGGYRKMRKVDADRSGYSLNTMIKFVLIMTEQRRSLFHGGKRSGETQHTFGANRSAMDIWRHIKYYQPKVDLFSVMRAIYVYDGDYTRQYCGTIHKRVFTNNISVRVFNDHSTDEFGLVWYQWRRIGLNE